MSKLSDKDITRLIAGFKDLAEQDIVGITSSDARNAVTTWLEEIGEISHAERFGHQVWKYQTSPKIKKMMREYNE